MIFLKNLAVLAILLSVVGCSTTGGTIGGLVPAPKLTKGSIENDRYVAKDNTFSVAVPHEKGSKEYTYMKIKEQYGDLGAYISFGPAAFDRSIYRVEVGKKLTSRKTDVVFEDAVDAIVAGYSQELENGYKAKVVLVSKEKMQINGQESYLIRLEQNARRKLTHDVVVTDYDTMAAIFWIQSSPEDPIEPQLDALQLATSFEVLE